MLSFSYKAFMIMDQLRRRAGISVVQLQSVSKIEQTCYSRISSGVYAGRSGVLLSEMERRVLHTLDVLTTGYATHALSQTFAPAKGDIKDVLISIEADLIPHTSQVDKDCDLAVIFGAANKLLNA